MAHLRGTGTTRRKAAGHVRQLRVSPGTLSAGTTLAGALRARAQRFLTLLAGIPRHRTPETVHDLRVATRRLIAALDIVRPALSDEEAERLRRRLRRLLHSFGPLRDLEIERTLLAGLVNEHPALRPLVRHSALRERQLLAPAIRRARQFDRAQMEKTLADVIGTLEAFVHPGPGEAALLASARSVRAQAYLAVLRARSGTDRANARSVHALRVAMKKFRYATEILAPFEEGISRRTLKAMNAMQLALGEVQDWTITIDSLTRKGGADFITKPGALVGILQSMTRRRTAILEEALGTLDRIPSFWNGKV